MLIFTHFYNPVMSRFFKFLPNEQRQAFLHEVTRADLMKRVLPNARAGASIRSCTYNSGKRCCGVTVGDAGVVGLGRIWRFTTRNFAARVAVIRTQTRLRSASHVTSLLHRASAEAQVVLRDSYLSAALQSCVLPCE
jgi:hypothetical protein